MYVNVDSNLYLDLYLYVYVCRQVYLCVYAQVKTCTVKCICIFTCRCMYPYMSLKMCMIEDGRAHVHLNVHVLVY